MPSGEKEKLITLPLKVILTQEGSTFFIKRNFAEATMKIEITKRVTLSYTLAPLGISLMIGVNIISL